MGTEREKYERSVRAKFPKEFIPMEVLCSYRAFYTIYTPTHSAAMGYGISYVAITANFIMTPMGVGGEVPRWNSERMVNRY